MPFLPPEQIFHVAGYLAMAGWLVLLLSPLKPKWADLAAGLVIPVLLSTAYAALVMAYFANSQGGFGSLPEVMQLFTQPGVALAGWIHYLAFDLFIGAWECRTARREGIAHWFVVPCLFLTFMLGPVGLLLFLAIRASYRLNRSATPAAA